MDVYLEKELKRVKHIDPDKRYWFIRTFGGEAFDIYVEDGFVGLGFNNVPYEYIEQAKREDKNSHKKLISFIENNSDYKKGEATKWANQLIAFQKDVKIGDTVIIPVRGSKKFAIGTVVSDVFLVKEPGTFKKGEKIEQLPEKRREVKWNKLITKDELQGDLSALFATHQGITNADRFSEFIEGTMSNIFIKKEFIYLIIRINQDEDINAFDLNRFLSSLTYFYHEFCRENGEEADEDLTIKIRLQSKGKMALKALGFAGLLGLSSLIVLSDDPELKLEIGNIKVEGKSKGGLHSLSDFLDRNQERQKRWELFKDSLAKLKVPTDLNNTNGDSINLTGKANQNNKPKKALKKAGGNSKKNGKQNNSNKKGE